jgi:hypothetical protein
LYRSPHRHIVHDLVRTLKKVDPHHVGVTPQNKTKKDSRAAEDLKALEVSALEETDSSRMVNQTLISNEAERSLRPKVA